MVMRGTRAKSIPRSGSATARVAGLIIRCSVSPITAGCSCSSFSMKWRKLPLPIAAPVSRVTLISRSTVVAVDVEELRALPIHHRPVAVVQIGDPPGQRRQRQRVRADEHLIVAEPDRQRRAVLRPDDQLGMTGEDHRQRIGPLQPPQRRTRRLDRRHAALQIQIDELGNGLGIGFGAELLALGLQFRAQFGVVLDDAVVHQGNPRGAVRMRVALGRRAMRRPARVADPDGAGQTALLQRRGQVAQLALGAAALDVAVHQGGDAGAVIAAIFQPPQRIQDDGRGGTAADNPNNATHSARPFPPDCIRRFCLGRSHRISIARPGFCTCRPRASASASGSTSSVITLPAPMTAPSPTETGATSATSEPTKTSAPIVVRCLLYPS